MPKTGRPPKKLTLAFRDFCRGVINKPEVLAALEAEALANPMFALRLAEFGIGRPFQAVHVTTERTDGVYRSNFADGTAVTNGETILPAAVADLPN